MDDKKYLKLAVERAKKSLEQGDFPAGAVLIKDGKVLAEATAQGFLQNDPTGHPETVIIRQACKQLKTLKIELVFIPDFEEEVFQTVKTWEEKNL